MRPASVSVRTAREVQSCCEVCACDTHSLYQVARREALLCGKPADSRPRGAEWGVWPQNFTCSVLNATIRAIIITSLSIQRPLSPLYKYETEKNRPFLSLLPLLVPFSSIPKRVFIFSRLYSSFHVLVSFLSCGYLPYCWGRTLCCHNAVARLKTRP